MTEQDLSAATGTLDTSETGGATSSAVVEAVPLGAALPEGRAFRPESETRDLVNAAYGVTDADPYVEADIVVPEGAPVSDAFVVVEQEMPDLPENDPGPDLNQAAMDAAAAAAEAAAAADEADVDADQQAAADAGVSVPGDDQQQQVQEPVPAAQEPAPAAPAPEDTQTATEAVQEAPAAPSDSSQAAADALAAADATLAAQPEQPQS